MMLLSKFEFESSRKYRAVLTVDLEIHLAMGYRGEHQFIHDNTTRGWLYDDDLTICAGYASDLCSPGFYFLGRWFGTYSRGAEIPAFLHDFARRFARPLVPCSPWDSAGSDVLFFNALTMVHFPARDIYHGAVNGPVGKLWQRLNRPRPDVSCIHCQPPP